MVRVDYDRLKNTQSVDYYNRNFQLINFDPIRTKYPRKNVKVQKPPFYDEMIYIVEKMGDKFGSFIRIDMYLTPTGPYFGEFTIYPGSGKFSLFTKKTDRYMGLLWQNKSFVCDPGEEPFTKEHFEKVFQNYLNNKTKNVVNKNGGNKHGGNKTGGTRQSVGKPLWMWRHRL